MRGRTAKKIKPTDGGGSENKGTKESCSETDPDYTKAGLVPGQKSSPSSGLAEKNQSNWSATL